MSEKIISPGNESSPAGGNAGLLFQSTADGETKSQASREAAAEKIDPGVLSRLNGFKSERRHAYERREAWIEILDRLLEELREISMYEDSAFDILDGEDIEDPFKRGYLEGFKAGRESILQKIEKMLEWMEE